MMSVDLHQVEFLVQEVVTSLSKECHSSYERAGEAQTLFIRSGVEGTCP